MQRQIHEEKTKVMVNGHRYIWVDYAKTIGMFAIVLGHVLPKGSTLHIYIYSFHVPLFFFLAGCVFTTGKKNYKEFLVDKAKRLLVPYLAFALFSTAIYFLMLRFLGERMPVREDINGILSELLKILVGYCDSNAPLWFLPSMFVLLAICFPLIRISSKKVSIKNKMLWGVIIVSFLWLAIDESFLQCYHLPYKLELVLHMISMFMLGYLFRNSNLQNRINKTPYGVRFLIVAGLILLGMFLGLSNDLVAYTSEYYGNWIMYYISALSTILGICLSCTTLSANRVVTYVSKSTVSIVVMHKFPIMFFQLIPAISLSMERQPELIGVVIALFSIVMCLAAQGVIKTICPKLLGL